MLFYKGLDNSEPRRWVLINIDEQKKILTACHLPQALWFVYVRTWDGTRGRKTERHVTPTNLMDILVEIFEFGSHCQ